MHSIVNIERAHVNSIIANEDNGFSVRCSLETFLSNEGNTKKIIGLHTERAQKVGKQSKTTLLQLCDGGHCLIVQLPVDESKNLPAHLLNFLNLPFFTFVGIGINKALMNLESEFGLTCNNAIEIGPSSWDLLNKTEEKCRIVRQFLSSSKPFTASEFYLFGNPSSAVFEDWGTFRLSQNQITLATASAYFAFKIGNLLMAEYC